MDKAQDTPTRTFVFSATLLIPIKTGLVWFLAATPVPAWMTDADAIDWLHATLVDDGCLRVTKLVSTADASGARTVTERIPTIIGGNAVATITPLHVPLFDPNEGIQYGPT